VGSNFSQQILPTHTFKHPPKDLDVLIVSGGQGSLVLELHDEIKYIKDVYPSLKYILSVCTGSTLLARAGILDGKNATNKQNWEWATATGPKVNWLPGRWVVDGKRALILPFLDID
jgi:putative intracellular protease/amidase